MDSLHTPSAFTAHRKLLHLPSTGTEGQTIVVFPAIKGTNEHFKTEIILAGEGVIHVSLTYALTDPDSQPRTPAGCQGFGV